MSLLHNRRGLLPMAKTVRVLLVEDHALVRAGLAAMLRRLPGIEIVGEAANGHDALRLIKESRPTLVLADIALPSLNGIEVLARITKEYPEVRVIMLSMHVDEEHVRHALQLGASGFLAKDSTPEELVLAIDVMERGGIYLSSKITSLVIKVYAESTDTPNIQHTQRESEPLSRLTSRQREILQLVAEGHSTKEIATLLKVTTKTVEVHRLQLMKRLNIHNIAGLVRYAVRYGVTDVN